MKNEIMQRVYFIYRLRLVAHSPLTKLVALLAGIGVGSMLVSIKNVWLNVLHQHGLGLAFNYSLSAMLHTQLVVQFLLALIFLLAAFLVKDIISRFAVPFVSRHGFQRA